VKNRTDGAYALVYAAHDVAIVQDTVDRSHRVQWRFLPRYSYAKRGICRRRVSVCLSHSGIVSKRLNVESRK